jgi:uncharacterized membrane protein
MVVEARMHDWTEDALSELPVRGGFRLRGLEMTRLETFTDAAFAFATTMLVISLSGIPGSVDDLVHALKDVPAFLASFATIASFWNAHRRWSRRFGLEDGWSTFTSLALVFVMLIYVYPLKMVFGSLFVWLSNGALPAGGFSFRAADLPTLFVIYGIGFFALTGLISLLYVRALRAANQLLLDERERVLTRSDVVSFSVMAATGLASALAAGLLPSHLGIWAGFFYATLPITMPIVAIRYAKRAESIAAD